MRKRIPTISLRRLGVATTLLGLIGVGVALAATPASAVVGPEVTPVFILGALNRNCDDLAIVNGGGQTWLEVDINPPGNGTFGPITITNFDGVARTFDWSSTIGIDAVYVKGGAGGSNLYVYAPTAQSPEQFSDDGLTTPGTSGNGVSHMSFCYDESNPTTTTTTSTTAPTSRRRRPRRRPPRRRPRRPRRRRRRPRRRRRRPRRRRRRPRRRRRRPRPPSRFSASR